MNIALDIGSPENVREQSRLTAALALEHGTARLEARLVRRFGFARAVWEGSRALGAACAAALLAVLVPLAQIGGAL